MVEVTSLPVQSGFDLAVGPDSTKVWPGRSVDVAALELLGMTITEDGHLIFTVPDDLHG